MEGDPLVRVVAQLIVVVGFKLGQKIEYVKLTNN